MKFIQNLFRRFQNETKDSSVDQILNSLITNVGLTGEGNPQELIGQGRISFRERPHVAHNCFVKAVDLARESGDQQMFGRALVELANSVLHYYPDGAGDVWNIRRLLALRASEVFRSIGDDEGYASALRVRATIESGSFGRELLEESLRICRKIQDVRGVMTTLLRLGNHVALFGDRCEANALKRQALEMARVLGDCEFVAECLSSLAIGFDGPQEEHRAILDEAQMLYGRLGEKSAQARCLLNCAVLVCDESALEERRGYLETAIQIAGEAGDLSLQATCLDILIRDLRDQGHFSKVALLEQQRDLLPKDEFPPEMIKGLEQAFASEDPETMTSAVRACFGKPIH